MTRSKPILAIAVASVVHLLFTCVHAQVGWTLLNSGTTSNLRDIAVLDSANAICVGDSGLILKTTDGGETWGRTVMGSSPWYAVSFCGHLHGFIVGNTTALRTTDGGSTWTSHLTNSPAPLLDICCVDSKAVIAVGLNGTILRSSDAGATWALRPSGTTQPLAGVSVVHSGYGLAVGGAGPFGGGSAFVRTTNAGKDWTTIPQPPGVLHEMCDVAIADSNSAIAAGSFYYVAASSDLLRSIDSGSQWSYVSSYFNTRRFRHVCLVDEAIGYAVAGEYIGGVGSEVRRTSDGGATWQSAGVFPTYDLNALWFSDSLNGFVVGRYGVILRTRSGGITSVNPGRGELVEQFALLQNYPNPFNPTTTIRFQIPEVRSQRSDVLGHPSSVSLRVFDLLGREVATLVNEEMRPGSYEKRFDGSNLASGVYLYKLQAGVFVETKKLILLK